MRERPSVGRPLDLQARVGAYSNFAGDCCCARSPCMVRVLAFRNVSQREFALAIGYRVIRTVDDNHIGSHTRVDIAKQSTDARAVELHFSDLANRVQPEIELLAVTKGKDV